MRDVGLTGRVAIVTGAARGIGAAVAAALANRGATVAAVDADTATLERRAAELGASGQRVVPYWMDVTDPAGVEATVAEVESGLGGVQILVNVAGALRTGPLVEMTDQDWYAVFSVNATGVFYVSRAVASRMRARRCGTIVTVSSNSAAVPRMHMGAYCASKAASTLFTKCLGLELAEYGIRCNVVAPGSTDTPMLRSMWSDDYRPGDVITGSADHYRVGIPLRKLAQPVDVADAVAFLISDQASHITMHELRVDGGASL